MQDNIFHMGTVPLQPVTQKPIINNNFMYSNKFSEGINKWANAIMKFEGWYVGSNSYKCNNPGNIRCGGYYYLSTFIRSLGATACSFKNFAIFPSKQVGYEALCQFLLYAQQNKLYSYANYAKKQGKSICSILDFYNVYAPTGDNNVPNNYANFIAKELGLSLNHPINQI